MESLPTESNLATYPRLSGENLEKNKLIYARLADIAARHSCNPSQLALAWLLHQGDDVIPIPGKHHPSIHVFYVGHLVNLVTFCIIVQKEASFLTQGSNRYTTFATMVFPL